jgi:hypothetical protein
MGSLLVLRVIEGGCSSLGFEVEVGFGEIFASVVTEDLMDANERAVSLTLS